MPNLDREEYRPQEYQGGARHYLGGFSVRVFKSGVTSVYREDPVFLQNFDTEEEAVAFIQTTIALEKASG